MFPIIFLINDLYFLITAVIEQIFILTAELTIPVGIPTKETKGEMETHPVSFDAKISKLIYYNVQHNLNSCQPFCAYY